MWLNRVGETFIEANFQNLQWNNEINNVTELIKVSTELEEEKNKAKTRLRILNLFILFPIEKGNRTKNVSNIRKILIAMIFESLVKQ